MDNDLKKYFVALMQGRKFPVDLLKLLDFQTEEKGRTINFKREISDPLYLTETEILYPKSSHPLIHHNYLNQEDRANVDIMCNVAAMGDTADKMAFIAAQERGVLGYWLGCSESLTAPYLYLLDTEGQYGICEGQNFADTLCYQAYLESGLEQFNLLSDLFKEMGIIVLPKSEERIYSGMTARNKETVMSPQMFRHNRYNHYRKENGLPPI